MSDVYSRGRGRGRGRGRSRSTSGPPSRPPPGRGSGRKSQDDRRPAAIDVKSKETEVDKAQDEMKPPRRPGPGAKGKEIALRTNRLSVSVGMDTIHHYDVKFDPEPRKAKQNVRIVQVLTETFAQELGGAKPAYDGRANLFTAKLLPFPDREGKFSVTLKLEPDDVEEKTFKVVIHWVADVNVQQLKDVVSGKIQFFPFDVLQTLDIIMRMTPRLRFHTVGRSVFRPPDPMTSERIELGQGREVWFGYHQSVRPSMWSLDLTVNVSATAFYEDCSVYDFLCKTLNLSCEHEITRPLNERDRIKFLREIRGLKVAVTHLGRQKRKYSVVDVTQVGADQLVFPFVKDDGTTVDCTVQKYFLDKYNTRLKYSFLSCLQVAPFEKKRFLPIEVCTIAPGQRCVKKLTEQQMAQMIKRTARSAPDREQEIRQIISEAAFCSDPYLQEFGIRVDSRMCELKGRVLSPPQMNVGDNVEFYPSQGEWNMRERTFFEGKSVDCWALLSFTSEREFDQKASRYFSSQLQRMSRTLNMPITRGPSFIRSAPTADQLATWFDQMDKKFGSDLKLIIVVTSPRVRGGYDEVKKLGDIVYGIPTQCIQLRRAVECRPQVLANICLKINAKLGGTNYVIAAEERSRVLKEPVMFLGADVTHPAHGEKDDRWPSIAAVVGSMDRHACKYAGHVCIQKQRQEIISNLTEMVKGLLEEFYRQTTKAPKRIVFYRDGVSEGQFQQKGRTLRSGYPRTIELSEPIVLDSTGLNPGPFTLQGTNTYLVGTGRRRILIDTGEGREGYPALVKEVLQQQDCNIEHVLVTHWHGDHVGGIRDVCELQTDDTVSLFKFPRLSTRDETIGVNISYSFLNKEEEVFETEGATLRALYTPGHTDDHMAIILEEENALFSGDCILGEGTAVFEDLYDYMKSLQRLSALNPTKIYPGHGPVVENAKEVMEGYIAHRNQREKQILDVLESGEQSGYSAMDLVKVIYKDTPEHLHVAAASNVAHHLQKLCKENRICRSDVGERWTVSKL